MNRNEVAQVLTKVQLGDNRQVDRLVLEYWVEAIGDPVVCDVEDALEAVVQHRRILPGVWLEPGHVLTGAKIAKERREREIRRRQPRQIEPRQITLDREEFDRLTQIAIDEARAARGVVPVSDGVNQ
jgi:hypothetical protein